MNKPDLTTLSSDFTLRRKAPLMTVLLVILVTTAILGASVSMLWSNIDTRIFLTTSDAFHDWFLLRDVLKNAVNFTSVANPADLSQAVFDTGYDSLDAVRDMRDRRLVSNSNFNSVAPTFVATENVRLASFRPSLLWNLLRVSWCSVNSAIPGATPVTRSAGCDCIANQYLGFVIEARNASGNLATGGIFNTSLALRTKYSDNLMSCFDRRIVTRTKTCGKQCSVHSIGLVLYTNSVIFLTCVAYLLFSGHCYTFVDKWGETGQLIFLKTLVVLVGVTLCVPFFLRDVEANLFTIGGLLLSVLYLTVTLHETLNYPAMDASPMPAKRTPHPLTICLLVNLQLLFPAYGVLIGTAGFARDIWAVLSIMVTLGLMGMALQVLFLPLFSSVFFPEMTPLSFFSQRFVWTYWYLNDRSEQRDDELFNEIVMTVCYLVLWTLFMLLFIAYYNNNSMYKTGSIWMFIFFMSYLFSMLCLAIFDRISYSTIDSKGFDPSFHFSIFQQAMFLLTVAFNVLISITAIMDVFDHQVVFSD